MSTPIAPDVDGYLYKLKSRSSLFGNWTKRYFRINRVTSRLEYFHNVPDRSDAEPKWSMNLQELRDVKKQDGNIIRISGPQDVLMLKASSAAEQACWVSALQDYIGEIRKFEQAKLEDNVRQREEEARA